MRDEPPDRGDASREKGRTHKASGVALMTNSRHETSQAKHVAHTPPTSVESGSGRGHSQLQHHRMIANISDS